MASKSPSKSLPVRGRASGALEGVANKRWRQLERFAQALRSLGDKPMTQPGAERLAKRFGVHWATVYRYRARLREVDEATAISGRTRGWKPLASRLSAKQEQGIEEAISVLRKKPGPARVVDLVDEVSARCRLLRVPCPSRPAIDRRLKRHAGLKVHRRGVAAPGNADPRISPGSFVVQRPLDVVQIDHTPMDIVVVDDLYRQPLGKPYPRFHFDFETINPAVPIWAGTRPYQQVPFQWSCHVEHADGRLDHHEFLDVSGADPRQDCARQLADLMGGLGGCVLVYFQPFEETRLRELARDLPHLATDIQRVIAKLRDLLPIVRTHYYHPDQQGSYSIKAVLPTVVSELDYAGLEEVRDGGGAQRAYLELIDETTDEARRVSLSANLRAYCERDTQAMVELVRRLSA